MYRLLNTFSTLILENVKVTGHLGELKFRYVVVDFKHGELLRQMTQCKLHVLTNVTCYVDYIQQFGQE